SRVHRRDSAHVEHRRPHPARRNKDSASPGSITRKIVLTIILIYAAAVLRIVDFDRAISALGRGEFVLVYDADGREAETDLTIASEFVSPAAIRTLRKEAGGLICMTLQGRRGHTELTTALMIMAGLAPTATICEMMADDGRALSKEDAKAYARARNLVFLEGQDIVRAWRLWSV